MPLYSHNGELLVRAGALATSEDCCCADACSNCYRIDYEWEITDLQCSGPRTISGSVLIRSTDGTPTGGEIQCYTDPDVVSVDPGSTGKKMVLNYGELCGTGLGDTVLEFVCDGLSPGGGIIMDSEILDILDFANGICCGESLGTFSLTNEFQTLTVTISQNNAGECDCTGMTPVEPA